MYDYTKSKYDFSNSIETKKIVGKYFIVLEVIKNPKAAQDEIFDNFQCYLKLQEKESKDTLYYIYTNITESSFPFIIVGFFEKQKQLLIGKEFIIGNNELLEKTDIETGKEITIKTGQKWKCSDVIVEDKYYDIKVVFENSLGEKCAVYFGRFNSGFAPIFTLKEVGDYKKRFGQENFDLILQGKVKIGMTKDMCILSWGVPDRKNETITAGKKTEQWVYKNNYLYFNNGILTAMQ